MNESVQEVSDFVETGTIFGGSPDVNHLPWVVVRDQHAELLGTEEWNDLRERLVAPITGQRMSAEQRAEMRVLAEAYEQTLVRRFRRTGAWLVNDASADLINIARARLVGESHPFFEGLFDAYKAGGVPCGWEGEYPDGRLVVLFPL